MRIRNMRRSKGWSQQEFARLCGIERSLLGVVERGNRNFGLEILLPIVAGLKTSLAELLAG